MATVVPGVALRADHAVLPLQKLVQVFQRQAEQLQKHRARQRYGELLVEVAFAAIGEAVDHLVHQLGDAWFAPGHLPRREQRIEDAAVLRMLGRVDLQWNQRPDVAQIDGIHVRREQLGVLERHLDVGQPAEHDRLRRPEHRGSTRATPCTSAAAPRDPPPSGRRTLRFLSCSQPDTKRRRREVDPCLLPDRVPNERPRVHAAAGLSRWNDVYSNVCSNP